MNVNALRHHNGAFGLGGNMTNSQTNNTGINYTTSHPRQSSNSNQSHHIGNGNGTAGAQSQNPLAAATHQLGQHVSPELSEALRFQEQRLEQALRLHGNDPRALGFALGNHQPQQHPGHTQ